MAGVVGLPDVHEEHVRAIPVEVALHVASVRESDHFPNRLLMNPFGDCE
jgi:hypothetical protein